jgi:hypothetical protein
MLLAHGPAFPWIALDYRAGPVPKVTWIDVECGEELLLADSFGQFVAALVPISDFNDGDPRA